MAGHEDQGEEKKRDASRSILTLLGGLVLGFFPGMLAHRAMTESPLPLETFDWILKNGSSAFFLAGMVVVGGLYLVERKGRIEDQRRAEARLLASERRCADELRHEREERSALEREYRGELPRIIREYSPAPLMNKMMRALALNARALRDHIITEAELLELEGETPPDGTPLPKKER